LDRLQNKCTNCKEVKNNANFGICCHSTKLTYRSKSLSVFKLNFSKDQCMLPEDDLILETCKNVLSVNVKVLEF